MVVKIMGKDLDKDLEDQEEDKEKFQRHYEILEKLESDLGEAHMSVLLENKEIFYTILKLLDKDGSGKIDSNEFQAGLGLLNRRLPKESQIRDHMVLFNGLLESDDDKALDLERISDIFNLNNVTFTL